MSNALLNESDKGAISGKQKKHSDDNEGPNETAHSSNSIQETKFEFKN